MGLVFVGVSSGLVVFAVNSDPRDCLRATWVSVGGTPVSPLSLSRCHGLCDCFTLWVCGVGPTPPSHRG